MKKLKKFLKVFVFVFGFYTLINVGAVFAFSASDNIDCIGGDSIAIYNNDGADQSYLASGICPNSLAGMGFSNIEGEFIVFGYYNGGVNPGEYLDINSFNATGMSTGSIALSVTTEPETPTPTRTTAGIFLPIDEETGEQVGANALMASVGTATSDTVGNVAPVAVVVMSLILAFMFIVTIIGLIKKTDGTKETKKRI
jgi:hypothetical protein